MGRVHAADQRGFIRRTIKPALGHLQVRKVRGPILDKLYAELKRCGDLSCTGRPFTEHRNIPALAINPCDPRPAWQQVTDTLTEAIRSGFLASGDELPSITELVALQGIGTGVMRHALEALAADGLILVRRGQTAIVAGNPSSTPQGAEAARACPRLPQRWMPSARLSPDEGQHHPRHPQHPVRRVRCRPALGMDRPQPCRVSQAADHDPPPIPATSPDDVAKVIAEARAHSPALGLYLWLVVVTGVRRGELCGLQIRDIDLDRGLVHVAFNYVVRGGQRVRKDTKTHQDRWLAIDPDTCALIATYLERSEPCSRLSASSCEMTRSCFPTTRAYKAVEPGLGHPSDRCSRRCRRGGVRHQGRTALHRQPAPRGWLRPAQHRRTPWPQRRRCDHATALRRPGPRGGQASRVI